jgi:hypothetical protein
VDQDETQVWDDDDEEASRTQVWTEGGLIRIMARRCDTCIFRGGNLMHLEPGRVKGMVEDVVRAEGHIPCHDTLDYGHTDLPGAICRGMEQHPQAGPRSLFLRIAQAQGEAVLLHPDGREERVPYTALPSPYTPEQDEPGDRPAFVHGE